MKKIAEIPHDTTDDPIYGGGVIVAFTKEEIETIDRLQLAINGSGWSTAKFDKVDTRLHLQYGDLSPMFKLIRRFVAMKFYINDMRLGIEEMNSYLMNLESKQE